MQRALIYTGGDRLEARHLRFEERLVAPAAAPTAGPDEGALGEDLRSRERRLILEALRAGHGSRKFAAERLGISPRTLRYKLARMRDAGIDVPVANGPDE
jgi:two-component system response regulator FlrC